MLNQFVFNASSVGQPDSVIPRIRFEWLGRAENVGPYILNHISVIDFRGMQVVDEGLEELLLFSLGLVGHSTCLLLSLLRVIFIITNP